MNPNVLIVVLFVVFFVVVVGASWPGCVDAFRSPSSTTLHVETLWGLANRLRTMRVAYDLCRETGWRLVIVHNPDKGYGGAHPRELFDIPGIEYATTTPPKALKLVYNVKNDCHFKMGLKELRRKTAGRAHVAIKACGLDIPGLDMSKKTMYDRMTVAPRVLEACKPVLDVFASGKTVAGVHIRQGSAPDFAYGYFFGDWKKKPSDKEPTGCCHADKEATGDTPCPGNAPVVERFAKRMRKMPPETVFFVCSDRPGCLAFLRAEFPGRVLSNDWVRTDENDAFGAFCDWYCLSRCSSLILSGSSSFSHEARHVSGAPAKFV